jgi:hypothetical protein
MNKYVWLFGLVSAVALALITCAGLPTWVYVMLKCVAVVAGVLAGYHYPAPPTGQAVNTATVALLLLGALALTPGCKVGALGLSVNNPTFGSVGLTLDGGVIGRGRASTVPPVTNSAPK